MNRFYILSFSFLSNADDDTLSDLTVGTDTLYTLAETERGGPAVAAYGSLGPLNKEASSYFNTIALMSLISPCHFNDLTLGNIVPREEMSRAVI
jgi:hypothetical protein